MLSCREGENVALWGKLNLSESRQILQNELEPSVLFSVSLSLPSSSFFPLFCHTSPLHFLSLCPSALFPSQSHPGCAMSFYVFTPLLSPSFCQVSHVLNVAYGVTNLFPDQLVYKTLQILDVPETDITAYLGECSTFIDQAREQVRTYTNTTKKNTWLITFQFLLMYRSIISKMYQKFLKKKSKILSVLCII